MPELARLAQLLTDLRSGESAVLVLRGEAGIGKTALLDYVADRAADARVVRAVGVESEMELPFAALHQLCLPLLDGIESLPPPQREALETAFGLGAGRPPDRFLIGLALLGLLSDAAEPRPVVCLVDDAQWLDRSSAQALAFAARRLRAESVLVVFAERSESGTGDLAGLPELRLHGLSDADARELLAVSYAGPLDQQVRDRIIGETRGNPLALLELPRMFSSGDLAGGFAVPGGLQTTLELSFRRRLATLPEETQRLLLLAAADPTGDPVLLSTAAAELGLEIRAAAAAEAAAVLELGTRVTFRHPLLRSAAYVAASPDERRAAHAALAAATDPDADFDRRAWHHAQAAALPDEAVAAELEHSSDRARARGGLAAAAAFLERSAALTPDATRRAGRALDAAELKQRAGLFDAAEILLREADDEQLDDVQRARVERLAADLALVRTRGEDAPDLLLSAARRLAPIEPALSRATYLDALFAARTVGDRDALLRAARASLDAPRSADPGAIELLLIGHAVLLVEGFAEGMEILRPAITVYRTNPPSGDDETRALWFACDIAGTLWDDEARLALSARYVDVVREAGAFNLLPLALEVRAIARILTGGLAEAGAALEEATAVTEALGNPLLSDSGWLLLSAWRDTEGQAAGRIDASIRASVEKGEEGTASYAEFARATLCNGLGKYRQAFEVAERCCANHPLKGFGHVLSELVEAAVRCGELDQAESAFERLRERTRLSGSDWALGVEARARALLAEKTDPEPLYRESIERLGRTHARPDLARAHLLYGEWLRRGNRRSDARTELRHAYELFSSMGATSFTERARRELLATGEKVRRRVDETRGDLTPQEAQIARLAADGYTNPEIGAQLFLSPRTVEYHLRKVYPKLGVKSRRELRTAVGSI